MFTSGFTLGRSSVLFFAALIAFAQNSGTLTGVISDPSGAVVPHATLEVKNTETGVVYQGATSATGNYAFSLPRGTYECRLPQRDSRNTLARTWSFQ